MVQTALAGLVLFALMGVLFLRGKADNKDAIKSVVNMQKMYCVLDLQAKPQPTESPRRVWS